MLLWAVLVLGVAVFAGMGLGTLHMLFEKPPGRLTWKGALHGLAGATGVSLLWVALAHPVSGLSAHAAKMGAGGFAIAAGGLMTAALAGGLVMLAANLRHRPISGGLIAAHSVAAIFGYVLLATYLTLLR